MAYLYAELTRAEQRAIDKEEHEKRKALFASIVAGSKKSKVRADLAITDETTFTQLLAQQVREYNRTNPDPLSPDDFAAMIASSADEVERLEFEFKQSARAAWTKSNGGSAAGFVAAWPTLRAELLRAHLAESIKQAGSEGTVLGDRVAQFIAKVNAR